MLNTLMKSVWISMWRMFSFPTFRGFRRYFTVSFPHPPVLWLLNATIYMWSILMWKTMHVFISFLSDHGFRSSPLPISNETLCWKEQNVFYGFRSVFIWIILVTHYGKFFNITQVSSSVQNNIVSITLQIKISFLSTQV